MERRSRSKGKELAEVHRPRHVTESRSFVRNVRLEKHSPSQIPSQSCCQQSDTCTKVSKLNSEIGRLRNEIACLKSNQNGKIAQKSSSCCSKCAKLRNAETEIEFLRQRVAIFEAENTRLTENFKHNRRIDTTDHHIEASNEFTSKEQAKKLQAENDELKNKLSSTETNLLRCENFLSKITENKTDFVEKNRELQSMNDRLSREIDLLRKSSQKMMTSSFITPTANRLSRWHSDKNLIDNLHDKKINNATPTRTTTNPYCPVCRGIGKNRYSLQSPEKNPDTTADSGYTEKEHSPEKHPKIRTTLQQSDNQEKCRRIQDDLHRLKIDKAVLETENENLRRHYDSQKDEIRRLRLEIHNTKQDFISKPDNIGCKVVKKLHRSSASQNIPKTVPNDAEITALKLRLETEKTRYDANISLLSAQKVKLEQDNTTLKSTLDDIKQSNLGLQRQLIDSDGRFAKMLDEMRYQAKNQTLDQDKTDLKTSLNDYRSQLNMSEHQRKILEIRLTDQDRNLQTLQSQNDQLKSQINQAEKSVGEMNRSNKSDQLTMADLSSQLQNRDLEISQLKSIIKDLQDEYGKFRKCLTEQEANLQKLQRDLNQSQQIRSELQRENDKILDANEKLKFDLETAKLDNKNLMKQLELSIDEQEKLKRSCKVQEENMKSYERLLKEKEKDRSNLFTTYHELTTEVKRLENRKCENEGQLSLELQSKKLELQRAADHISDLASENEKLQKEHNLLKDQLKKCETRLEQLQQSWQNAKSQNESLVTDLSTLRQDLIQADSVKLDLVQEISKRDLELKKIRQYCDEVNLELALCQEQLCKEREQTLQLDKEVTTTRDAQLKAEVDAQRRRDDARCMRERLNEYELKLELQGQDLKTVRCKLNQAESEVKKLRQQLIDDHSSAS